MGRLMNSITRLGLALATSAAAVLLTAGVSSAAPAQHHALAYFYYGTYPTIEECSAYGVGYTNAHPESSGWQCRENADGGLDLYVDDGITD